MSDVPLVEARGLCRRFDVRRSWWKAGPPQVAVVDVDLAVRTGDLLGLVGESGSGKSTIARCLVGLLEPTQGQIRWQGEAVRDWPPARRRQFRRDAQLVFQDTATSLDPRLTVGDSVREPLDVQGDGTRRERAARVEMLLRLVGLDPVLAARRPGALSGGQRQRVALARAMALSPRLLVADEPVSSLDPSAQAHVINLLLDLRESHGLTCVLISHDLHLVGRVCQRVAVMCRGRLVEVGPLPRVFADPAHPYTRRLLDARLSLDPDEAASGRVDAATSVAAVDAELARPLVEVAPDHLAAVG